MLCVVFVPLTSALSAMRCDQSSVQKRRQKGFRVSQFALSLVGFKRHHSSERVKSIITGDLSRDVATLQRKSESSKSGKKIKTFIVTTIRNQKTKNV